jgi:hypothetical protein
MLKENELFNSEETMTLAQRRAFLQLSLSERRKILSEQAEDAARHYESEQSVQERETWQSGEIVEY